MTEPVSPAHLRKAFLAHLAGDFAAAEDLYRRSLADPALAQPAHRYLIRLLEMQHRWQEAADECRAALDREPHRPELKLHLATLLLGLGQYAEAWPLYEFRSQLAAGDHRPTLPYPEWDGGPIRSLTVWDEQGFGDTIQFCRFVPLLVNRGIAVTLIVRPELSDLLSGLGATVIPAQGQMKIPVADAWAMMGSLPGRLGVTLQTLGDGRPYLAAAAERQAKWASALAPAARIGVITRGKPAHTNDAHRSLPYEGAAFLLTLPGAVNLLPGESGLPTADFADTAALIDRLALIITVDTAVAHLAGAMGKPCWVLLPYVGTDWRWLQDGRRDSPWYPSLRLYRQPAIGDWASALHEVARDLPAFYAQAR